MTWHDMWRIPITNISVPLCFMDEWHFTLLSSPFSFSPWMTSRNLHCSWIFQWLLLRHFYYKWKRFLEKKEKLFPLFFFSFQGKIANFFLHTHITSHHPPTKAWLYAHIIMHSFPFYYVVWYFPWLHFFGLLIFKHIISNKMKIFPGKDRCKICGYFYNSYFIRKVHVFPETSWWGR